MKQNRPLPQWIRLRTGNTIRYNAKRRNWYVAVVLCVRVFVCVCLLPMLTLFALSLSRLPFCSHPASG